MYREWVKTLSAVPLFRNIQPDRLNSMLSCLNPGIRTYKKNRNIAVSGERFEGIGFVLSGSAAVIKEDAAGNRTIITILRPGDMFGEMAAFSKSKVWPATVLAQEECRVMILPPEKIVGSCEKACESHRLLIMNMLEIVSDKALLLNRKVEYLAIKSLRGRISAFLLEQYKKTGSLIFMLPMNRNNLADFLNVSRPSLSREMCRMRDEGIIDFHMSSVRIIDLEALKKF
mgnify:CR=1 FL=1